MTFTIPSIEQIAENAMKNPGEARDKYQNLLDKSHGEMNSYFQVNKDNVPSALKKPLGDSLHFFNRLQETGGNLPDSELKKWSEASLELLKKTNFPSAELGGLKLAEEFVHTKVLQGNLKAHDIQTLRRTFISALDALPWGTSKDSLAIKKILTESYTHFFDDAYVQFNKEHGKGRGWFRRALGLTVVLGASTIAFGVPIPLVVEATGQGGSFAGGFATGLVMVTAILGILAAGAAATGNLPVFLAATKPALPYLLIFTPTLVGVWGT